MFPRTLKDQLWLYQSKYPVITVTGPRQSGKTTLIRAIFPDYRYVSLEDPDMLSFAEEDPRLFLMQYPDRTIIDEAQRFPQLFSYLQSHVDLYGREGMYILSGSHNFLLMERISQTLAGRTAILKLLPFSLSELKTGGIEFQQPDEMLIKGFYPRLYDKGLNTSEFFPFYLQTYIERDVRSLLNVGDLGTFTKFIKLCAGRTGQMLNLSGLANECGISQPTAKSWLSVLESSYIIFLLRPWHRNFNKRIVKTPKLYFYDTGLVCHLLGVRSEDQLRAHYYRGEIFENWVIADLLKQQLHQGNDPQLYFWRDNTGNEIDLIMEDGMAVHAVEIKSAATYRPDFFKGLQIWEKLSGLSVSSTVLYGGDQSLQTRNGKLISWRDIDTTFSVTP